MPRYDYTLVNVFAETRFGGNPLAVFTDARGLSDTDMQNIARQMNLSECAFVFPADTPEAAARLRIFTPAYELPFAGHPTLGAAYVLQQQQSLPENFALQTVAKTVAVHGANSVMAFRLSGYTSQAAQLTPAQLAALSGIDAAQLDSQAYWVNAGTTQLLLQAHSREALANARISLPDLQAAAAEAGTHAALYLWCEQGDTVYVRLFIDFNGTIVEDSGTGSACANLGAWLLSQGRTPLRRTLHQGDHMRRPNRLYLRIDEQQNIEVGGRVIEIGRGYLDLP